MIRLGRMTLSLGLLATVLGQTGCFSTQALMNSLTSSQPLSSSTPPKDELPPDQGAKLCLVAAQNFEKNGDESMALLQYEKVHNLDPNNLEASRRLAVLYDRSCEFAKADAEYRKLAQARPRDAELFNDWGYSYYERTKWKEAEQHLRHALELDPHHERARSNLGLALGQQGRYHEAFEAFRAVVGEAEAHSNLAFVYWSQGKLDEARSECRLAQQLDSNCSKAHSILASLDQPRRPLTPLPVTDTRSAADRLAGRKPAASSPSRQMAGAAAGTDPARAPAVYRSPSGTAWVPVTPTAPSEIPAGTTGTVIFE